MKKNRLLFFSFLVSITGYAEPFVLDNQALKSGDIQASNIAIQWATSARDAEESNIMVRQIKKLNPDSLQALPKGGKINLNSPQKAAYFRVIIWKNGTGDPDFLTNWVDIVPNKIYTLNKEHLIPLVLMQGMGC